MLREQTHDPVPVSASGASEPYVGPRPFKREDRDIFFGRYRETLELSSLIIAHRELLIYAQSGAGKTSLIDAQLVPTLESEEEFEVLPLARVRSRTAQSMPDEKIKNIYMFNALADLSGGSLSLMERAQLTLRDYLKRRPRPPIGPPEETTDNPPAQTPTEIENQKQPRLPRAIIFDQFEELFTLYPHRYKDRQDFFEQVKDALTDDTYLRIVFSMREDYIAELDPYIDILPQKLSTRFRLEPLRQPNALKAVTEPLTADRVVNERKFAAEAAEELVESLMLIKVKTANGEKKEVLGEFVDPVQLQVVCQTLWEQLPKDVEIITKEHLKEYANIDAALLTYYENSIRRAIDATTENKKDLPTASGDRTAVTVMEAKIRKWFGQSLITPGGKRNMVPRGEFNTGPLPNNVVDELENQHLVRVEMRGDDKWYEISHDRLIPPIIESNRRWVLQQPWAKRKSEELEACTLKWIKAGRDPELLLDREELAQAKNWRDTPEAQAIGWSTKLDLFMRESQAAIEAEEHKQTQLLVIAQQERAQAEQERADAEQQRANAEQERANAEQERANAEQESAKAEHKRARQFKLGLVVASLLLLIASVTSVFAVLAEKKAHAAATEATREKENAVKARDEAQLAEVRATEEGKKTEAALEKAKQAEAQAKEEKQNAEQARDAAKLAEAKATEERKKTEAALEKAKQAEAKATQEKQNAEQARDAAKVSEAKATDEGKKKEAALKDATDARVVAEEETRKANEANRILTALRAEDLIGSELAVDPEKALSAALAVVEKWPDLGYARYGLGTAYVNWPEKHFVLRPEGRSVENAIFTPDSKSIVVTSLKEGGDTPRAAVSVWSVAGREYTLENTVVHERGIPAFDISKDGTRLVTEGADGKGRILWLKDNRQKELTGLTGPSPAIAFSPDGKFVASEGSTDDKKPGYVVFVWDAEDPRQTMPLRALQGHESAVTAIAFSPTDNSVLAAGSEKGTIGIWNPKTGELKRTLTGHTDRVNSISFDIAGNLLSASDDGTARVWDTSTGNELLKLSGHFGYVTSATFDPKGQRILTFGQGKGLSREDNVVRVWNAKTGDLLLIIGGHTDWISAARFSANGEMIVTASRDGTAQLWNSRNGRHLMSLKGPRGAILDASFSPDDKSVLTVGTDHSVHVWQIPDDVLRPRIFFARKVEGDRPDWGPITVDFDSEQRIASVGTDGSVRFWDPKAPISTEQMKLPPLPDPDHPESNPSYLTDIKRSPGGRYIALAFREVSGKPETVKRASIVQVWDTIDRRYIPLVPTVDASLASEAPIYKLEFSPKGTYLLTAGANGTATLWETASWKPHRLELKPVPGEIAESGVKGIRPKKEAGLILDAAFDSTEQWVATAHENGIVEVFATANQENVSVFRTYTDDVLSVAFGRGQQLITGSADGTVGLWTIDGDSRGKVDNKFAVFDVRFSDKGFIVTASADSVIRVWEIGLSTFGPEDLVARFDTIDTPMSVAFSPDNTHIVVGSRLGFGQVFKCEACLPFEEIKSLAIKKNPRKLTKTEEGDVLGIGNLKTREKDVSKKPE